MKIEVKNFIFNGLTYGIIFFSLSLMLSYYLKLSLRETIFISSLMGIISFIVNGLVQTRFTKSLKTLKSIEISVEESETIKIEAPANHMIDDHLISGKLLLTEKRLVFKGFQNEQHSWLINSLISFKFHWTIFNIGGEFIIEDNSKNILVFEVDELQLWKKALVTS